MSMCKVIESLKCYSLEKEKQSDNRLDSWTESIFISNCN